MKFSLLANAHRVYNYCMTPIAKVATKVRQGSEKKVAEYWRNQPYQARLAALEQIRQEYHHWKNDAQPGFQRVFTIIKR
jgi:hypothetical protein